MTPIEKNIIVVDELGNEYEATYPKRAKGLVKNGRARFIDENKICLACPPDTMKTEDIEMSEHIADQSTETAETTAAPQYTVEYILSQLAEIQKQTAHLHECMVKLSEVQSGGPEDIGAQAKAQALSDIVRCRETTNQQMLAIYEKLLDRLINGMTEMQKWSAIQAIAGLAQIEGDESDEHMEARANIIDSFRQILRENK